MNMIPDSHKHEVNINAEDMLPGTIVDFATKFNGVEI